MAWWFPLLAAAFVTAGFPSLGLLLARRSPRGSIAASLAVLLLVLAYSFSAAPDTSVRRVLPFVCLGAGVGFLAVTAQAAVISRRRKSGVLGRSGAQVFAGEFRLMACASALAFLLAMALRHLASNLAG